MDLDENELEETKKKNGARNFISKQKVINLIKNRIDEIDREEWYEQDITKLKFYCQEELEKILFKIKEL